LLQEIADLVGSTVGVRGLHDAGHEARSYEMTGREALSMTEIAESISEGVGQTIR
jgi:hypothetical protein